MEKQKVELVIDTGILGPRRRDGRAGYVLVYRADKGAVDISDIVKYTESTENESLVKVMLKALCRLRKPVHLIIYTESRYIAAALTDWIQKWQQDGWINKKKKSVMPEWKEIKEILDQHEYEVALNGRNEYSQWLRTEVRREHGEINGKK